MQMLLKRLWADEKGFIISSELVLVGTIVGLGMIVGLAEVSSAVNHELHDVARGFLASNGNRNSNQDGNGIWDSDSEPEQSGADFNGND